MGSTNTFGAFAIFVTAALCLLRGVDGGSCKYEVWLVDQADSSNGTAQIGYGGYIHIFKSNDLKRIYQAINLGVEVSRLCFQQTGAYPVRPHMLFFNQANSHAVLAFVVSGHVVIFRAQDRKPLACFRTTPGFNGLRQAHAALPTSDDRFIIIANQNGKKVERINVDWKREVFIHDVNATLAMYGNCTTPNGALCEDPRLRPDNAPICIPALRDPPVAFVTLRGGGMLVLDITRTPMRIVAEYDNMTIGANGCGGVPAGKYMYINSGGGTAANLYEFKVYKLPNTGYSARNPPNTPAPKVVTDDSTGDRDAHYAGITYNSAGEPSYFWQPDRAQSVIDVFSFRSDKFVNRIELKGALSTDPTPDALVISPSMDYAFVTLRGLYPQSADPHVSTGSSPGLGILKLVHSGRSAKFTAIYPITNMVNGTNRADPHGLGLLPLSGDCKAPTTGRRLLRH